MESAHQQRSVAQPSSSTRSPRFFPNSASTQRPLRLFTLSLEGSVILCPKSTKTATLTPFRINTCKSVSKQMTLTSFRINTYEKQGRGVPLRTAGTTPVVCSTWRLYPLCPHSIAHTSCHHRGVLSPAPKSSLCSLC